jgi:hypothetical protein
LIGKELKDLMIDDTVSLKNIVDVEIVSGQEGWKYKEIIVTLSNDIKIPLELSRDRKTDKWSVKIKDIETDSKEGILDTSELQSLLAVTRDTYLPDGSPLIKSE